MPRLEPKYQIELTPEQDGTRCRHGAGLQFVAPVRRNFSTLDRRSTGHRRRQRRLCQEHLRQQRAAVIARREDQTLELSLVAEVNGSRFRRQSGAEELHHFERINTD